MIKHTIIPDSSFYICFLDDIIKPDFLTRLFSSNKFTCFTGPVIKKEIEKSVNYYHIKEYVNREVKNFNYFHYGEILRPFFSISEIQKGENEVIVISYILFSQGDSFTAILDDSGPKKFIIRNLPEINDFVEGTVGFTTDCCIKFNIYSQEETLSILESIRKSKFRIPDNIVDEYITQIRCFKNVKKY